MTSRDRVTAALRRQPADRIPVFMWFHPCTAARLAAILEIPQAYVGEAMGNDIRQAWVNNNYAMEGIVNEEEGESHIDAVAEKYGLKVLAKLPIDPKISAACDAGMVEMFEGDWFDALAEQLAGAK